MWQQASRQKEGEQGGSRDGLGDASSNLGQAK